MFFSVARTCRPDLAGSEDFERQESRYTKFQLNPVVFHAWSRRGRVGFMPTYIFGLRSWPFVLGVRGWFHVVVVGIVMLEIDLDKFGRSPSAETHGRVVVAMEAREGPNTQDGTKHLMAVNIFTSSNSAVGS